MDTVEVKTSELIGQALDWMVAKAEGLLVNDTTGLDRGLCKPYCYSPSTLWIQGGPLIDKYGICTLQYSKDCHDLDPENTWTACGRGDDNYFEAPTALIAACRSIIAHKFGETVSIPSELMQ